MNTKERMEMFTDLASEIIVKTDNQTKQQLFDELIVMITFNMYNKDRNFSDYEMLKKVLKIIK